jgi:ribosomal protein S12 methylthiotransferase accessory factor
MTKQLKGKDCTLESSIARFEAFFKRLGIDPEVCSWLNPVPHVWSVHIKCAQCPILFTNGKGNSKQAALASAYGEFVERLVTLYFFADYYWNIDIDDQQKWFHHPNEKWIEISEKIPHTILSRSLERFYSQEGEVKLSMLLDRNMGHKGVCCLPYTRESDGKQVFIPQNIIANLYVSNGMSCGNSEYEAKVQALSEIIERGVKNKIISEGITLPIITDSFISQFPSIIEGVNELRSDKFSVTVRDASLGGKYPVVNITLINHRDGGVFCAFGSHPIFEVALERTLTELLQGRDLDQLDNFQVPHSDMEYVSSAQNLEEHFIDSAGVVSWNFFSTDADYPFVPWGQTEFADSKEQWDYLVSILHQDRYEIYICDYSFLEEQVYRVIVPGFSEIYPLEELYLNNNSEALPIVNLFLNLHSLSVNEGQEMLHLLNNLAVSSYDPLSDFMGLVLPPGSFWSDVSVGQLRTLLHLLTGDCLTAKEELSMLPDNTLFWSGLLNYLEMLEEQEIEIQALEQVYGRDLIDVYETIIKKRSFENLPLFDWNMYEQMIDVWKKVH